MAQLTKWGTCRGRTRSRPVTQDCLLYHRPGLGSSKSSWIHRGTSNQNFSELRNFLQNLSDHILIHVPKTRFPGFFGATIIFSSSKRAPWSQVCNPEVGSEPETQPWTCRDGEFGARSAVGLRSKISQDTGIFLKIRLVTFSFVF